jgi:hypothetical protein
MGAPERVGVVPRADATVVGRVKAAGGILLGKTVTQRRPEASASVRTSPGLSGAAQCRDVRSVTGVSVVMPEPLPRDHPDDLACPVDGRATAFARRDAQTGDQDCMS